MRKTYYKGIAIDPDGKYREVSYGEPLHISLGAEVGGYIEIVRPQGLEDPLVMIVNEEGLLRHLPPNRFGCLLYGTREHGHPIVGKVVIMAEGMVDGEPDLIGIDDLEAADSYKVDSVMKSLRSMLEAESEKTNLGFLDGEPGESVEQQSLFGGDNGEET